MENTHSIKIQKYQLFEPGLFPDTVLQIVYQIGYQPKTKVLVADLPRFKEMLLKAGVVKAFFLDDDDQTVAVVTDAHGDPMHWHLNDLDISLDQLVQMVTNHEQQLWKGSTLLYEDSFVTEEHSFPFTDVR